MAAEMKTEVLEDMLERLRNINQTLDTMTTILVQTQDSMHSAVQCQDYLNKSIKPLHTALLQQEEPASTIRATLPVQTE